MWEIYAIGETAGQVWAFLNTNGKSTLSALERSVKAPKPLVDMAVGWLAREGKLELGEEKRSVRVWLRDN